jgi:hypothetical protein
MAFEVRRPSDALGEKPKLSKFGRTAVTIAVVVALIVVGSVYAAVQANRARDQLAQAVEDAIDRAEIACRNAASAVGASTVATDRIAEYGRQIDGARIVADKAALAQEMITYTLGLAGSNQSQVDELNGARNRIVLALEKYRGA